MFKGHIVIVDFSRPVSWFGPWSISWTTMVRSGVLFLGWFGGGRGATRIQSFGRQRRDHHEDDEQHQQHVNQTE